jgi:cytochrome c oxidase subunit 4
MRSIPSIFREQVSGAGTAPGISGNHDMQGGHGHHHGLSHVISPVVLITVFALLMLLTLVTVGITQFDFGYKINLIVALAIAVVKATLVIAYFMHLRYDSLFYTAIVGMCMVFIGVFIVTTVIDTEQNQPILVPQPVTAAP